MLHSWSELLLLYRRKNTALFKFCSSFRHGAARWLPSSEHGVDTAGKAGENSLMTQKHLSICLVFGLLVYEGLDTSIHLPFYY